jgi:hypothetical protein
MSKPSWAIPDKKWLTDPPKIEPNDNTEQEVFMCYTGYGDGDHWWGGWKTYVRLWSCLRYGTNLNRNPDCKQYIKNLKTNEIVWRSWEDENKYRYDS